jgi:phosphatidylserine/phosphatidylglycerophosphate/cardiolipin synthase-like enzyme
MVRAGVDLLEDGNPYILHHKVIILDDEIVITGSYNFSASAAEKNDENVLIIHSPEIAATYLDEYERVVQQAEEAEP